MSSLRVCLIIGSQKYCFILKPICFTPLSSTDPNSTNTDLEKKYEFDPVFLHYLVRELHLSSVYRQAIIGTFTQLKLVLEQKCDTQYNLIDYNWNDRMLYMVLEQCELNHALSWLSTLGGAFSALGDYSAQCAETAGRISHKQFQLALRLNDPQILSRCRLYYALSLIQRKRFKSAAFLIRHEYTWTKQQAVPDIRLIKMCKGIWSKLQYEYSIR